MIGICIEAGITCPSCDNSIPLNALVSSVKCSSCGENHELSLDNWRSILEDSIINAPASKEGEGRSLSIFGSYNYKVTYGRLSPRYDDTKDTIDIDTLLASIDSGSVLHPVSKAPTSIRRIPEQYGNAFQGVIAIVGEEPSLLPGTQGKQPVNENSSRPVAFQCPNCAGNLTIDGTKRMVDCSFCDTQVYLPDDLWHTLHPAKKKKRWFLLFNELQRSVEWPREVWDAVRDDEGNFYFVIEPSHCEPSLLISTKQDRMLRWKRCDLEITPATTRGDPRMAITGDNRLLITCADRSKLFVVSAEDGTTIDILDEPKEKGESPEQHFSMKGCYDFGVFPNNTLLIYRSCDRKDDSGYFCELQRFDLKGNLLQLWDPSIEKLSFFEKVKKSISSKTIPYSITDTKGYPVGARDTDIRLTIGRDGSVYILSFISLLKLTPAGKKLYAIKLPCHYTTGGPAVNADGEVFIVAHREDDRVEILSVSQDGTDVSVAEASTRDGGPIEESGVLTLSPDGGFSILGYNGKWFDVESRLPGSKKLFNSI